MSILNNTKRIRPPIHPGEILRELFIPDYDLTTAKLANALGVSRQTINEILRERRAVTPAMALRLSKLFGNSPEFWLKAQYTHDLWATEKENKRELSRIQPIKVSQNKPEAEPTHTNF